MQLYDCIYTNVCKYTQHKLEYLFVQKFLPKNFSKTAIYNVVLCHSKSVKTIDIRLTFLYMPKYMPTFHLHAVPNFVAKSTN